MTIVVAAQNPNPMDSIRALPGYRASHDTTRLLTPARIAKKPEWIAYVRRSRERYDADTAAMGKELRAAGLAHMTRAPYVHDFSVKDYMTPAWFAGDSARRMATVILSFQAPNGGWSKHVDFTQHPRAPGESYFAESADWEWISTIDNASTTEELRFLDRANRVRRDASYERAFLRGIDYLLGMQYPNGCYPQVYPLVGSYHDAATFNDDATVNVLRLFRDVAGGEYAYVPRDRRDRAGAAVEKGIACILGAQITDKGKLAAWGQQHDPLTLAPISARSYELTSLASLETAGVADFLMTIPAPSRRIVAAVYAATDWFRATPISGYSYAGYELRKDPRAAPLWGRLYELGTGRIIMANRDGKTLYDWNQLTDRRAGYQWYTTRPAETLKAFDAWSRQHPR